VRESQSNLYQARALRLYLLLAALFISALVACNLIFRKFFIWSPFGEGEAWYQFTVELSVGILPYPLTFLITDLISELFGQRKANQVVLSGLVASVFVLGIIWLASAAEATGWSPVSNEQFEHVFGQTGLAVAASMIAYLVAQLIDIRVFHFWKRLTSGRMLWVRNNFSTLTSQMADTSVVLFLLCSFGEIPWEKFWPLFVMGFLFKAAVAVLDTPLFYLGTWAGSRYLGIPMGGEARLGD
jgi:queuosine precursor transporter